jgi:hypothetical protein
VYRYQDMLEKHQLNKFFMDFYFKKGSIGAIRWRKEHRRKNRKSAGGILRPLPDEDEPEWIMGGNSDENVMRVRQGIVDRAEKMGSETTKEKKEESARDEEEDDLEDFAEAEIAVGNVEVPQERNENLNLLEREPGKSLYCVVKRSSMYHRQSGRPERGWELPSCEVIFTDANKELEGLHLVCLADPI